MSEPKNHHFVPRLILRNFCDQDGNLHGYRKPNPENGIFPVKPDNMFAQKDLHTITDKKGNKNRTLENKYSKIEGHVDPIIKFFIATVSENKIPELAPEDKEIWDYYFYHQLKRTPDFHEAILRENSTEEALGKHIAEIEKEVGPIPIEEKKQYLAPENRKRIMQQMRVVALSQTNKKALELLHGVGLALLVIRATHRSFIIGSNPFFRATRGTSHALGNPDTELWLPISSRIAVGPYGPPNTFHVLQMPEEQVRRFNEWIFKQSTQIASNSEALTLSLAKRHMRHFRKEKAADGL